VTARRLVTASAEETERAGEELAAELGPGDVVALVGELGAGKTCFARGLVRGLGGGDAVSSPTFVLVNRYRGRVPIHHLDAYRTGSLSEVLDLGFDELLASAQSLPQKKYREALVAHADSARHSRELLKIRTDVPLPPSDLSAFQYRGAKRQECFELFAELGFRSLVTEYAPTAETVDKEYALVASAEDLASLKETLTRSGQFAFSFSGDCPGGMRAGLIGISFSVGPHWAR
jgi:tRNA threonylcarbamoyl adenosine modification protein YjeE